MFPFESLILDSICFPVVNHLTGMWLESFASAPWVTYNTREEHVLNNLKHSSAWWWLARLSRNIIRSCGFNHHSDIMTSKSVSRNWPPPSYGLTIYQTSVCLSTQIHSSRLPNPCGNSWMPRVYLDASESSKVQKEAQGNSLSPLGPGQFLITQDTPSCLHPSHLTANPTTNTPVFPVLSLLCCAPHRFRHR